MFALLLALDGGRSWYARFASAKPPQSQSPDRADARAIAWPPGSDLKDDAPIGARVYAQHCAVCHGPDGRGDGPAAVALHPRPRDFTGGVFKLKSTASNEPPAFDDVRDAITRGMPGSAMPEWQDILSADDVTAVAEYVRDLGPHRAWGNPPHAAEPLLVPASADPALQGRELYGALSCGACHGIQGRGDGAAARELKDTWGQPDPPRDLSAPWTFSGGDSAEALYARIAFGMGGTPMPGYAEVAEPAQIAAVVAYVRSLARTPPWEPNGTFDDGVRAPDPVVRGEYLVESSMCGLCHSPVDAAGITLATHYLAGGMKITADAHGVFFAGNLTSDNDTGLGSWTVEQIADAIRSGHTRGRRLNLWSMPWQIFGTLTDADANAIASYLKTVPPVRNRVPAALHFGLLETVARKLRAPRPAAIPERLTRSPGNFGEEEPSATIALDLPLRVMEWLQAVILVGGLIMFVAVRAPKHGRRRRRRWPAVAFALVVVALVGIGVTIARLPALDMLSAEPLIRTFNAALPMPVEASVSRNTVAVLQRGRYLYGVASCAYCHSSDGSGGKKTSATTFGTIWMPNLTPHETGVGEWSDVALLRALVSGVGREGAAFHWQAMPWTQFSNYSVEDQHALLAYLRALPPVENGIPAAVSPKPNDCAAYTFWVRDSDDTPGCH
ncbi:MAG: c-type cytochrome [Deltaproteobacteria bacterium]|nr:c-type cytochrome [Deltaproteobacteria bacterium]MBI3388893.1 c-type cytochrome [Deltaproteobacteria bacterium]